MESTRRWTLADVSAWSPPHAYDVVFSNATFQWLPDHETLLPHLMQAVATGGVFAFQVPYNFDAPARADARGRGQGPWASKLKNVRDSACSRRRAITISWLRSPPRSTSGRPTYLQVLEGDDPVYRWVSATGLRPFTDALGAKSGKPSSPNTSALRMAYPKRADGKTLFPFKRLFAVTGK